MEGNGPQAGAFPAGAEFSPGVLRHLQRVATAGFAADCCGILTGERLTLWNGTLVRVTGLVQAAPSESADPSYPQGKTAVELLLTRHAREAVGVYRISGDAPDPAEFGVPVGAGMDDGAVIVRLRGGRTFRTPLPRPRTVPPPAAGIAAACAVVLLGGWWAVHRSSTPAPGPDSRPITAMRSLGLHAESRGTALAVAWDTRSAAIRTAHQGVLTVHDGTHSSRFNLDSGQLAAGELTYYPASPEVRFELEAGGLRDGIRVAATPQLAAAENVPPADPGAPAPPTAPERRAPPKPQRGSASRSDPEQRPSPFVPPVKAAAPVRGADFPEPPASVVSRGYEPPSFSRPDSPQRDLGVTITVETAPASRLTRFVRRVPLVRRLKKEGDFVPAKPLRTVNPALTAADQKRITTESVVEVRVGVSDDGKVEFAELASDRSRASAAIQTAALDSARKWTFQPATSGDEKVRSELILRFHFHPPESASR